MADTKTPFLLNPLYSRYELGIAQLGNEVLKYCVTLTPQTRSKKLEAFLTMFVGIMLVIFLVVMPTTRTSSKLENLVLFLEYSAKIYIVLAVAVLLIFIANETRPYVRRTRAAYHRLRQTRTVIEGELISLEWRGYDITYRTRSWKKVTVIDQVITARYTFVSPTTGVTLSGMVQRKRPDLRRVPLPPPGTPVRVLYADDDAHMML